MLVRSATLLLLMPPVSASGSVLSAVFTCLPSKKAHLKTLEKVVIGPDVVVVIVTGAIVSQ